MKTLFYALAILWAMTTVASAQTVIDCKLANNKGVIITKEASTTPASYNWKNYGNGQVQQAVEEHDTVTAADVADDEMMLEVLSSLRVSASRVGHAETFLLDSDAEDIISVFVFFDSNGALLKGAYIANMARIQSCR